jgi:hypothetical protein
MSSEQKRAWILGLVSIAGYLIYLAVVGPGQADYAPAMLWTIGASIAGSIVLHIAVTIRGPHEGKDDRDREIGHFGEYVGRSTIVLGGVAGLILALVQADYFWIANALYLGFVLSAALGSAARLAAYRWGLPGGHAW